MGFLEKSRPRSTSADPFGNFFDDFFQGFGRNLPSLNSKQEWPEMFSRSADFVPQMEVKEKNGHFKVSAELPGLDENDIKIHLDQDRLVIEGEKKFEGSEEKDGRTYSERRYGSFRRDIQLPYEVDQERVKAKFRNGVLKVDLEKAPDARERSRQIPISDK